MPRRKKNSGKDPSFQFYWKDWRGETRLDLVSAAARGIWIDLIAASCDMPTPGVFWLEGSALVEGELARGCHGGSETNRQRTWLVKELNSKGILKRFGPDSEFPNAFYVKRIYEDMKLRRVRQEAGLKGGNPNLLNQNPANSETLLNQKANQKGGSSSSSSKPLYSLKQKLTKMRLPAEQVRHCLRCLRCKERDSVHAFRDSTDQPYGLCPECLPKDIDPTAERNFIA